MTIQDVKLVGAAGDGTETMLVLNSNGNVEAEYAWLSVDQTGYEADMWCDSITWDPANAPVAYGQGFYIYTMSSTVKAMSAGAVAAVDNKFGIGVGYNLSGNATPKNLSIQELTLSGASGDGTETMLVLNSNGNVEAEYTWLSVDQTGYESDMWCDSITWDPISSELPAGQGVYIYSANGNSNVVIPTVL